MIKLTDKLKAHYKHLPEDERQRLQVEAHLLGSSDSNDKITHCIDTLGGELDSLVSHRQHIKERNTTPGHIRMYALSRQAVPTRDWSGLTSFGRARINSINLF